MSDNKEFCLQWNEHKYTLVQAFNNFLYSEALLDCTLAAEGHYLHAHKAVICACSPYLETLLLQHYEKHPIVILKDVKFRELKLMVDYMYKGEVNVSQKELEHFLVAAESLQIKGLTYEKGDEGDTTFKKRKESALIKKPKSISGNQSQVPEGLALSRQSSDSLSELQPDDSLKTREGSTSPTPQKQTRQRKLLQGKEDDHVENSCDLPTNEDLKNPEPVKSSNLPEGFLKEKIVVQSDMFTEPKIECNDRRKSINDEVMDFTVDDNEGQHNGSVFVENGAEPLDSSNNTNDNHALWQHTAGDSLIDNPVDDGHRDSQNSQSELAYNAETSAFTCDHCCKTFTKKRSLRRHVQEILRVQRKYKCAFCKFYAKRKQHHFNCPYFIIFNKDKNIL